LLHHCACCRDRAQAPWLDRRAFIGSGLTAIGLASYGALAPASAQEAGSAKPHRIDVHHHFSPPQWIAEVKGRELLQPANVNWTPAKSIEDHQSRAVVWRQGGDTPACP
jgi:hypothetical protein